MKIEPSTKPTRDRAEKVDRDNRGGWPSHPLKRELNRSRDIGPGGKAVMTNEWVAKRETL
jgi:hypothetical protein